MPGTETLGKLFFKLFLRDLAARTRCSRKANRRDKHRGTGAFIVSGVPVSSLPARRRLVVRRIIRRKRLRRRGEFVARLRHKIAAPPTRSEFVLTFRTGRDDHGAAGGRTEN